MASSGFVESGFDSQSRIVTSTVSVVRPAIADQLEEIRGSVQLAVRLQMPAFPEGAAPVLQPDTDIVESAGGEAVDVLRLPVPRIEVADAEQEARCAVDAKPIADNADSDPSVDGRSGGRYGLVPPRGRHLARGPGRPPARLRMRSAGTPAVSSSCAYRVSTRYLGGGSEKVKRA